MNPHDHAKSHNIGSKSNHILGISLDESSGHVNHSNQNVPGASMHIEGVDKKAMSEKVEERVNLKSSRA